jgi:predicted phosphodiesterase
MELQIQIISDLHLEFMNDLPDFLNNNISAKYLFLAGDIGYPNDKKGLFNKFIDWCCDNYKKVFYVIGNHESYTSDIIIVKNTIKNISKIKSNFIFLDKGIISNIEGYKVIGCTLWSNIDKYAYNQMNDRKYIKLNGKNITIDDFINMHNEDKKWIEDNTDHNTIVMTHYIPSYNLIHELYKKPEYKSINSAFASDLDELIYKSRLWIYGHTHKSSDIMFDNVTRCICNSHGYYKDDAEYSGFTMKPFII